MKISRFLFLLAIAALISAFLAYFSYSYFVIEKITKLDLSVKVDDHFGLNADTDGIRFGMVKPGTSSERSLLLSNNASYPLRVEILKYGEIADWVRISENNFVLQSRENKQVNFTVYAPNVEYGNYSGTVKIIFKKTYNVGHK